MANKKVSQLTSKPSVLTTDLFPIADPTTGQLYKTTISDLGTAIGSGVSSVNGLVGAVVLDTDDIQELVSPTNKWFTDTRARAALSASSPLTYNSGTGVFGIQVANGSQNGYLSSADWTTFNGKQAALSGTGFVKSTGGTISYDTNTYLTTSSAVSTYLALAGGTMTGVLFGASASFSGFVGFNGNTSPLYPVDVAGSGRFAGDLRIESTNPRIYLTDTDNNPDYFISNTDGTFTIYDVTNSASRLTISSSQIQPRLPIVSNSSIQGTAFYSDSFFSATTFVQATTFMDSPSYRLTGGTSPTGLYFGHTDKVVLANYTVGGGIDFETNGGNITMQLSSAGVLSTTGGASFSGALSGTSASFTGNMTIGEDLTLTNVGTAASNILATSTSGILSLTAGASSGYTGGGTIELVANDRSGTNTRGEVYISAGNASANTANGFIALQTANTERLRVTYAGNVGIGTTSPTSYASNTLQINGSSSASIKITNSTSGGANTDGLDLLESGTEAYIWNRSNGLMSFATNNSERMRITSSGNVGIGTTSPSGKLSVSSDQSSNNQLINIIGTQSGYSQEWGFGIPGSTRDLRLYDYTSGIPRFLFSKVGEIAFNGSTDVGNNYYDKMVMGYYNSNYGWIQTYGGTSLQLNKLGNAVFAGAVRLDILSDRRVKDNIQPITGALDKVMSLTGKKFHLKDEEEGKIRYGFIAQELEGILDEFVIQTNTTFKKGDLEVQNVKSIENWASSWSALLVEAIKELKEELDTLKNK